MRTFRVVMRSQHANLQRGSEFSVAEEDVTYAIEQGLKSGVLIDVSGGRGRAEEAQGGGTERSSPGVGESGPKKGTRNGAGGLCSVPVGAEVGGTEDESKGADGKSL